MCRLCWLDGRQYISSQSVDNFSSLVSRDVFLEENLHTECQEHFSRPALHWARYRILDCLQSPNCARRRTNLSPSKKVVHVILGLHSA